MTEVSFKTTAHEFRVIAKIADRARAMEKAHGGRLRSAQDWQMDISATHANGNPLRLDALLEADDFNFAHDVFGICRHLDRETGKLTGFFVPRFSDHSAESAA